MASNTSIETIILSNLQKDDTYARKILPFIKEEYFLDDASKNIFKTIKEYTDKYSNLPTIPTLEIEIDKKTFQEEVHKNIHRLLDDIKVYDDQPDPQWMIDETETFCQDRSLYLALTEAISISNGDHKQLSKTSIPKLLEDALSVSFQTKIGHDYQRDAHDRYLSYIDKPEKIPFLLKALNDITDGGVERKTINALMSGTGGGKSMMLCNLASDYIKQGFDCLYITLEMSENKIARRIDANLMDVSMKDLANLKEQQYLTNFQNKVGSRKFGTLKMVEYPNGSAHAGHFLNLLKEFQLKEKFIPDIIIVDYLNICASSRVKRGEKSYEYVKSITEELRALAQKTNTVVWTATQANKAGVNSTDLDITNTSESMGSTHTFDFFLGLVTTEELAKLGQVLCIQLKNRYDDVYKNAKFVVGVDRSKMRFYDLSTQSTYKQAVAPTQNNQQPSVTNKAVNNTNTMKKFSIKTTVNGDQSSDE